MTRINALIISPLIALTTLVFIGKGFYTLAFIGVLVSFILCLVNLANRSKLNDGELLVSTYAGALPTVFGMFWLMVALLVELS